MTRIIKTIEIEGQEATALFDSGAVYTYVRERLVSGVHTRAVPATKVGLGGREIQIRRYCLVEGKIEGLEFFTDAVPVDEIGHADGHDLDVLVGARTLEQWQIGLHPATDTLDLEGLRRREFTEF
jgi:hypothetical protein